MNMCQRDTFLEQNEKEREKSHQVPIGDREMRANILDPAASSQIVNYLPPKDWKRRLRAHLGNWLQSQTRNWHSVILTLSYFLAIRSQSGTMASFSSAPNVECVQFPDVGIQSEESRLSIFGPNYASFNQSSWNHRFKFSTPFHSH